MIGGSASRHVVRLGGGVATAAAAAAVVGVLDRTFPDGRPLTAYDVPHYLLQARLAVTHGIGAFGASGIPGFRGDRPGFAVLSALAPVDPATFVFAGRVVAGLAIGLAAGAVAVEGFGGRRGALPPFPPLARPAPRPAGALGDAPPGAPPRRGARGSTPVAPARCLPAGGPDPRRGVGGIGPHRDRRLRGDPGRRLQGVSGRGVRARDPH